MASIQSMITAITTKLGTDIDDHKISNIPDDLEGYRLLHANGELLVAYTGSSFQDTQVQKPTFYNRNAKFRIIVIKKHLTSQNGLYALLDSVRDSLSGLIIDSTMKARLMPVEEGFLEQVEKEWRYFIDFKSTTITYQPS